MYYISEKSMSAIQAEYKDYVLSKTELPDNAGTGFLKLVWHHPKDPDRSLTFIQTDDNHVIVTCNRFSAVFRYPTDHSMKKFCLLGQEMLLLKLECIGPNCTPVAYSNEAVKAELESWLSQQLETMTDKHRIMEASIVVQKMIDASRSVLRSRDWKDRVYNQYKQILKDCGCTDVEHLALIGSAYTKPFLAITAALAQMGTRF